MFVFPGRLYACGSGAILGLGVEEGVVITEPTEVTFPFADDEIVAVSACSHVLACSKGWYLQHCMAH
jgi:hypothetical protein